MSQPPPGHVAKSVDVKQWNEGQEALKAG